MDDAQQELLLASFLLTREIGKATAFRMNCSNELANELAELFEKWAKELSEV